MAAIAAMQSDCVSDHKPGEWINYQLPDEEEFTQETRYGSQIITALPSPCKESIFCKNKGRPCVAE